MIIIWFMATAFLGTALLFVIGHKCGYRFSTYVSVSHKSMFDDDDDDDEFPEPTYPMHPLYERN